MSSTNQAATKLRRTINDPDSFLLCPGVYDGFSARVALQVGFEGIYMTGAGSSASILGHADLGLLTQTHMRENAEMIASLGALPEYQNSPIPLISDADTGYGGPIMVSRTVQQYAMSGVAGLHIEDRVQTKRCGHLAGKQVEELDVFLSRIRTDALQTHGYAEAIRRLKGAYQAGADVAFFEGLTSKEQAKQIIEDLKPMPVLLNMVEAGATPSFTVQEAREIGFKIMIVPFVTIVTAYFAMKQGLERLKNEGCTEATKTLRPQALFRICGVDGDMQIDNAAGGKEFSVGID